MKISDRVRVPFTKIRKISEQLYSPRELKALVLFIVLGVAVVLYRGGRNLYLLYVPEARDSTEQIVKARQDSLFTFLSAKARKKDSLFFSLPEDSLLPVSVKRRIVMAGSKSKNIPQHSIALNTATKEDLMRLPSIGPSSADHIIEYRKERGKFRSLEELRNIKGFGAKKFEKIKNFLTLE